MFELFVTSLTIMKITLFSWKILFFNKVAGIRPASVLKKRLRDRYFAVNFTKFLRAPFL